MAGAQVHTVPYTNYENLSGLTGQWEPENSRTPWEQNDQTRSPSPPSTASTPDDNPDTNRETQLDNNNVKKGDAGAGGRLIVCDTIASTKQENPILPRLADLENPVETGSVGSRTTMSLEETADEDQGGTGEGVRWVYNTSFLDPKGTDSPLYGSDYEESDNSRLSFSCFESAKQQNNYSNSNKNRRSKPGRNDNALKKALGLNRSERSGKSAAVKRQAKHNNSYSRNSKEAMHSEIKRLLTTNPAGLVGAVQYSGLTTCLPYPDNTAVLRYLSQLAQKTQTSISNGGLNIPLVPFENCATPGDSPGPPGPPSQLTSDDVIVRRDVSGSNRKGRRKNIGNSRQLSHTLNNATQPQHTSPVLPNVTTLASPILAKTAVYPSSTESSPDIDSATAPLNLSTKTKKSPATKRSPEVIAMATDQVQQQLSRSPTKDRLEHSTFDCKLCEQSVCKLLGNGNEDHHTAVMEEDGDVISTPSGDVTGNGSGSHVCEFCHVGFATAQKLKSHQRCHIKPFLCTVCEKSFTNSGNLKKHMRTHTGEKPYMCPLCNAAWANPSNLKRHMVKHDIHKCSSCDKDFPNSCTLSVVTERLSGNRLYVCHNCLTENSSKYLKGKQQSP